MQTVQCPSCGEIALQLSPPRDGDCQRCGARFRDGMRICPTCGGKNKIKDEICQNCGESLTVFRTVLSRQDPASSSHRFEQMRTQAESIKTKGNLESAARMSQFLGIDQRRLSAEREAQIIQQEKDRLLIRNVLIAVGIFLGLVAITALIVLL